MEGAIKLLDILNKEGHKSYIVGGAVRDMILGVAYNDIDLATPARPEVVMSILNRYSNYTCVPTGIKHGTITVIDSSLGTEYEVSTFRKDTSCDGRHAIVEYTTDLKTDLSRRDFTINSIAYDPFTEEYVDPFEGAKDIEDGIIRCVGDATTRFQEDHLRMLRALRFRAVLNFRLEHGAMEAIATSCALIKKVSAERVRDEILKCFSKADKPSGMFNRMYSLGLLGRIIPELMQAKGFAQNKYHKYDVFDHTMQAMDAIPKEHPLIRWAALLHDIGKPESCKDYGTPHASFHGHELISERIARPILNRLRFSTKDKNYVLHLIKNHMFKVSADMKDSAIRRLVAKIGVEYLDDVSILKYGDRVGNGTKEALELDLNRAAINRRFKKIKEADAAFKIKDMAISGKDVIEVLNIKQGKEIGIILKALFENVLDDPSLNDRDTLLKMLTEQFN